MLFITGIESRKSFKWICLVLAALLLVQIMPLSVIANKTSESMHNGYLVGFDSAENRTAFEDRYGGEKITECLTLVKGCIIPSLIRRANGVTYVTPNGYMDAKAEDPSDPLYSDQWGVKQVGANQLWYRGDIYFSEYSTDVDQLHAAEIKVAVLDTGIDGTHEDLFGRVGNGYDVISGEIISGMVDSDVSEDSHGTMVAGIIAAATNNNIGISGVSGEYPVTVLPVRVLNNHDSGTIADIVAGIYWAIENGADIINMSFGKRLSYFPEPLVQAVSDAINANILVFAASGNDGSSSIDNCYPASISGVHPVGAYEQNADGYYYMCNFSNGDYSKIKNGFYCAPGRDILTTVKGGEYGLFTGTSAACAFISGYAAVLASVSKATGKMNVNGIETVILNSIFSSGYYGYGRKLEMSHCSIGDLAGASGEGQEPGLTYSFSAPKTALGTESFSISFTKGADLVSEVAFFCDAQEFQRNTDSWYVPNYAAVCIANDGTNPDTYEAEIDFSEVSAGSYKVYACVKLKTDDWSDMDWSEHWWGTFCNAAGSQQKKCSSISVIRPGSGSILLIKDPDGCSMGNQTVYVLEADTGKFLKTLKSDTLGYVVVPASCYKNGQALIACYTEDFIYYQTVLQGSETEIDHLSLESRSVTVYGPEGYPVSGAKVSVSTPDGSVVIGTTDIDGSVSFLSDCGKYEFSAFCLQSVENGKTFNGLLSGTCEFTDKNSVLYLSTVNSGCLEIPSLSAESVHSVDLQFKSGNNKFDFYELTESLFYLSEGTWNVSADYAFMNENGYTNNLSFDLGNLSVLSGNHTLSVDPTHLNLVLDWQTAVMRPGESFQYDLYMEDSFGNRVQYGLYYDCALYEGDELLSTSSYGVPYMEDKPGQYSVQFTVSDYTYQCYPGVIFDTNTVSAYFSFSLTGSISVYKPDGCEAWVEVSAYALLSDGSTEKLNQLGDNWDFFRFDAIDLDFGTPIGIIAEGSMEYEGEYRTIIWTWSGAFTDDEQSITLTDNAVRKLTAEYRNAPEYMDNSFYFAFETAGPKVFSKCYWNSDFENGIWIPENEGNYVFVNSEWNTVNEDSDEGYSSYKLITGEIPAHTKDTQLSIDFSVSFYTGHYRFPENADAALWISLPETGNIGLNVSGETELKIDQREAFVSAKVLDTTSWNAEKTSFSFELPFPTTTPETVEAVPLPFDSISLTPVSNISKEDNAVLDIYLTDMNGLRYSDISVHSGNSEVMEESSGDSYLPFIYYREKGTEEWIKVKADSLSKVNLGILPVGTYEAKAEFDFTVYKYPVQYCSLPQYDYSILVTGPTSEFTVGTNSTLAVSLSARAIQNTASVTVSSMPEAVVSIFVVRPDNSEEIIKTLKIGPEGYATASYIPLLSGRHLFRAEATLDGQTAFSDDAELYLQCFVPTPTSFSAENNGEGSVILSFSWPEAEGLTAVLSREGKELKRFSSGPVHYTDMGLEEGRIYTYTLAIVNSEGLQGSELYVSVRVAAAADTQAPTVPSDFNVVLNGSTAALSWGKSEDNVSVKAYIVYRNGEELTRVVSRSYLDCGLGLRKSYTYQVAAVDPSGNISQKSIEKTLTTSGEVTIDSIEWKASKMVGDAIDGESLNVTVIAAEGIDKVSAILFYIDVENKEQEKHIELSPSGQYYFGTFSLENASIIESITAVAQMDGMPDVEKVLSVQKECVVRSLTVTLPDGNWDQVPRELMNYVKLTLNSKKAGISAYKYMRTEGITFTNLIPSDDYELTVNWQHQDVYTQSNITLAPGKDIQMTIEDTGLRVLEVQVLLNDGENLKPIDDVVILNNRRYQPDSNGRLYGTKGDTAILLPADIRSLTVKSTPSLELTGSDYQFSQGTQEIKDNVNSYTFVAEFLPLTEKTISFLNENHDPIPNVNMMVSQMVLGEMVSYTLTTDNSGEARVNLISDTPFTVEPRGNYAVIPGSSGTIVLNGKMFKYSVTDSLNALSENYKNYSGLGNMSFVLSELTAKESLSVRFLDSYGVPAAGTKVKLYPEWTTDNNEAVTGTDGVAVFELLQTAESYSVIIDRDNNQGNRIDRISAFTVKETDRISGTVTLKKDQYYAPVISGLKNGERALLYLTGGPIQNDFTYFAANETVYTGVNLPGISGDLAHYAVIPTTGVYGIQFGNITQESVGNKTVYEWYCEAFEQIGAMTGTNDASGTDNIIVDDDGCTVVFLPITDSGEAYSGTCYYEILLDGVSAFRISGAGKISLRLKWGSSFTVRYVDQNGLYYCDEMDITVPEKKEETLTLNLKSHYCNLILTDENGTERPELLKSCYLFDSSFEYVNDVSGFETLRLVAPVTDDTVYVFVRFGQNDITKRSYMMLNESKNWTKFIFKTAEIFDGRTVSEKIPISGVDKPSLNRSNLLTVSAVSNIKVQSVRMEGTDEAYSKVSFNYKGASRENQAFDLELPDGAELTEPMPQQLLYYCTYPISFTVPTSVIHDGAEIRVKANGETLQTVALKADPFSVYTQNTISSSEIDFSEVKENKPLLPEMGYFRNMKENEPLLMGRTYDFISAVKELNKSFLFFTSTETDFEISVNIDGIPVNYANESIYSMRGSSTETTVFNSITQPGYESESGRIWQNSYQLGKIACFDEKTLEGALILPFPEPDSYPHTYEVSAVMRYKDLNESDAYVYEYRTEYVTIYADTAYLRCFDFIHYDSSTFGNILEEQSPMYWIRPKTEQEISEYQERKTFCLNWNNTSLFKFRAFFEKPEEVESAWVVADVVENCKNYCFQLSYDEDQGIWTGTGNLGSAYCIPSHFTIVYSLKRASAVTDFPVFDMKDLKQSAIMGINDAGLPEGWSAELTDPKEMTLDKCLSVWSEYANSIAGLKGDDLNSYLDEFFGKYGSVPYPAVKLSTDAGESVTLYFHYELDSDTTQNIEGRRVGIRMENGEVMPIRIISESDGSNAFVTYSGDAAILMPGNTNSMDAAVLSWGQAVMKGVKCGCEIVSGGLDIYTKASLIVDADAAIFDTSDEWVKYLPPDALEDYRDWQDKKVINDILDLGIGALGSLLPITLPITTAFDVWLFKKTNDTEDIYKEIARRNLRNKAQIERWKRTHPTDYDPNMTKYIDPSGYVFEAVDENRLEGVCATIQTKQKDGTWVNWNSEDYNEGPSTQITDGNGSYGWNVLEGKWRVLFEKDGYISTQSEELNVPPAHLDVNIGMVSTSVPYLLDTIPTKGGDFVDFSFNLHMRTEDILKSVVLIFNGEEVPSAITPLDESLTSAGNKQSANSAAPPKGIAVAKSFRITPEDPLPVGASCFVKLKSPCRAYNGFVLDAMEGCYTVIPEKADYEPARILSFKNDGYSMPTEKTLDLSSELLSDGENILTRAVWESLSPKAFSVDQSGLVKTLGGGTGYICVTVDGVSALCAIADNVQANRITVHHVNAKTGEEISDVKYYWGAPGEDYAIDAEQIAGYRTETKVLYGIMGNENSDLTISYIPEMSDINVISFSDNSLCVSFASAFHGQVAVLAAGYDKEGCMLWIVSDRIQSPQNGDVISLDLPERNAVQRRIYVLSEQGQPLSMSKVF